MIKDGTLWSRWEAEYCASVPADFARNLALLEAMYAEARAVLAFPPADPLEGIETKIRLAKVVNVRTASRADRQGS